MGIVGCYVSSTGIEPVSASSNLLHHHGFRFVVVESVSSSWNPPRCCRICSVVVQSVSVFLPCRRRTCFAVVEPTLPLSNLGGGWKLFHCLLWWSGIRYTTGQWDGSYKGIAKMSHDKRHGSCFGTYFVGLPFPGSPLMFPPSLVPFPGSFVGRG